LDKGYTFFISYRRDTGKDFATHLKEGLEREKVHAFLDIADVPSISTNNSEWWRCTYEALIISDVFLLIMTDGIENSDEASREILLAMEAQKMFMLFRHQGLPRRVEISLNGRKLNLGNYSQIGFETKEDLLRQVLRSLAKVNVSRAPADYIVEDKHKEEVAGFWRIFRNPFSSEQNKQSALQQLIKLKAFEELGIIVSNPWEPIHFKRKAFEALIENRKENEAFLLHIVRNPWQPREFRDQAKRTLQQGAA
jgi:hypothetical protein